MPRVKHLNKPDEPHDDRWHYLDSRDEEHEGSYIEWKYFNFIQKDLAGYIIYYILDPEKKTKFGGGRLLIRIFKDGVMHGWVKKIDMNKIELDAISASLRMGKAKIEEHDSYHYKLIRKGRNTSWDLTYKQKTPSIESFNDIHTSFVRWEKVSWLVKMPRAEVKGNIRIGKKTFRINGLGYSDTNWGEMVPILTKYEWGQFNEKSFSLVFGILFGLKEINSSYFYIILKKRLIKLENAKCKVEHTKWQKDKIAGMEIPSESVFLVKSKEYEINFSTKLIVYDSPGMKIHPLLPKVVVSEQIVEYKGFIKKNGKILHKFKGRGFEEWSGKTWKDVPITF